MQALAGKGRVQMFRKLWGKRKSVVITWLVSYLIILLVPNMISLIVYRESHQSLKEEIRRANDTLLNQVREIMDNQIETVKRLNMEIVWNTRLRNLLYSSLTPSERMYEAYLVTKDMYVYRTSYATVDEFYVYWAAEDSVIAPGTVWESRLGYSLLHGSKTIAYEKWVDMLRNGTVRGFVPLKRIDINTPQQSLAYVSPLPPDSNGNPAGSVVIMLDVDRLLGTLRNVEWFSGGHVYLIGPGGRVLVNGGSDDGANAPAFFELPDGNGERAEAGGAEVFTLPSRQAELTYVSVIPSERFWEKAVYVRRIAFAGLAVSLIGGCALTFVLLYRNYAPLRRLVRSLPVTADRDGLTAKSDEYARIQCVVSAAWNEKEQYAVQLQQQNRLIRSNVLARLLKGKPGGHLPLDDALTTFDIRFESDEFAVILFYLEDASGFFSDESRLTEHEKERLRQFVVANVVEELASRRHAGYVLEIDDMTACLVNFRAGDDRGHEADLTEIAEKACGFLEERFGIRLRASVSGIHRSIRAIAQAYGEALDAMEYGLIVGGPGVVAYGDIHPDEADESSLGYHYPLQIEQQWMNYMMAGDAANAVAVLRDTLDRHFGRPVVSIHLAKCLVFNLIGTMIKTVNELGVIEECSFVRQPDRLDDLLGGRPAASVHEQLEAMVREVCCLAAARQEQAARQARSASLRKLADDVADFVNRHYHDVNLNISMIGEYFDMKSTYLSKLFKDQTDEGLLDYINRIRIAKTKELMAADDALPIADVARQVGFGQAATFIRVFKKYEGITPGKFKEIS